MDLNKTLFLFFASFQFFVVFIVIVISSVAISVSPEYSLWMIGCCVLLFAGVTYLNIETQLENAKKDDDSKRNATISTTCGWIWVTWLAYYSLFPSLGLFEVGNGIKVFLLGSTVALSYASKHYPKTWMSHAVFLLFVYASALPSSADRESDKFVFYKAIVFIVLYSIVDLEEIIQDKLIAEESLKTDKRITPIYVCSKEIGNFSEEVLVSAELQIVKSAWVLFSPVAASYIAILQAFLIVVSTRSKIKVTKKEPILPVNTKKIADDPQKIEPARKNRKRKSAKTVLNKLPENLKF